MKTPNFFTMACVLLCAFTTSGDAEPEKKSPAPQASIPALGAGLLYSLEQFGKVSTSAEAQAAFEAASKQILAGGGGVLLIPADANAEWKPDNILQEEWRQPLPPAPAKQWGVGPGVTVIDCRGGTIKLSPPQVSGLKISRTLQLKKDQSLPHWNYNPMIQMDNTVARGSTSYRDWLQEDVRAGQDQRFYVPTIRGIFPGMFINAGDFSNVQRLYVKSLGYDTQKKLWYFTADTSADLKKGSILHNKSHVNVVRMDTYSHNENQTFDLMLWRHNYSQGDNYLVDAWFKYMGDVHSTAGDENGVVFAGFVEPEYNCFRGTVESWDVAKSELKYKDGQNTNTLGSGRPIINLNPKKWVTLGTAMIVRPSTQEGDAVVKGKAYPTVVAPNQLGISSLKVGGLIRFSKDAPVTEAVVGRYFAVDDPSEYVPGVEKVRRWYLIDSVAVNPDGTKDLRIVRHWWGAKSAGSPTLYKPENYSTDGREKPLKYIIAPGVNAYDVSDGLPASRQRIVRLSPAPFTGSAEDFAAGDSIEQAVGPDPFHPIPFRSWTWDSIPSTFPAPIFDISNLGKVQRHSVLTVAGGEGDLEKDLKTRYDRNAVWNKIISMEATCNNGIVFAGDVANAAIVFEQPRNRAQPIKWRYAEGRKEASLTVSPTDGVMRFEGGGVAVPGGLSAVGGISGSGTPANNLRGINIPVPSGSKEIAIKLPRAESDAAYAVFIEPSWVTTQAVMKRTADSFVVQFDKPSPNGATLDWLLVR